LAKKRHRINFERVKKGGDIGQKGIFDRDTGRKTRPFIVQPGIVNTQDKIAGERNLAAKNSPVEKNQVDSKQKEERQ